MTRPHKLHGIERLKHVIYRLWHPWYYDPLSLEEDFYFTYRVHRTTVKNVWHMHD